MMLLPLLVMLSAIPGQALYFEVPGAIDVDAVTIEFKGQKLALAPSDNDWFGLVGVDLDVAPGRYPLTVTYNSADDQSNTEVVDIDVRAVSYTHLTLPTTPYV